jgi:hypothetical protein
MGRIPPFEDGGVKVVDELVVRGGELDDGVEERRDVSGDSLESGTGASFEDVVTENDGRSLFYDVPLLGAQAYVNGPELPDLFVESDIFGQMKQGVHD